MNTKRSVTWALLAGAAACAAVAAMPGCELLVDFDRSKIPGIDGSLGDVTESPDAPASPDGGDDVGIPALDAGPDAARNPDAAIDAGGEGGDSTAPTPDGAPDTGVDAPNEVSTGPDGAADGGDSGD